jgi:hypothetical protein
MKLIPKLIAIALAITIIFFLSLWYLGLKGVVTAVPTSLLIVVLTNLEWITSLIASSYKIFRRFNFWFEKNAVAKRIESMITIASRRVNEEGVSVLPHGVEVKWVEPMKRDAFLKEGKVVVCLESSYNEARNLARATLLYTADDLIRGSQRFISPRVTRSIIFAVSRKMFKSDKRFDALKYLNEEFIEPEADKDPKIREYVMSMEKMDEQGYLTRILLREFSQLDAKLSPALTDFDAWSETERFTHLLGVFVGKKPDEDVPLEYNGRIIKADLLPVTRTLLEFDLSNYERAAKMQFDSGIDTIYALAWGFNVMLAKSVVKTIESMNTYHKQEECVFTSLRGQGRFNSYIAVLTRINR